MGWWPRGELRVAPTRHAAAPIGPVVRVSCAQHAQHAHGCTGGGQRWHRAQQSTVSVIVRVGPFVVSAHTRTSSSTVNTSPSWMLVSPSFSAAACAVGSMRTSEARIRTRLPLPARQSSRLWVLCRARQTGNRPGLPALARWRVGLLPARAAGGPGRQGRAGRVAPWHHGRDGARTCAVGVKGLCLPMHLASCTPACRRQPRHLPAAALREEASRQQLPAPALSLPPPARRDSWCLLHKPLCTAWVVKPAADVCVRR